MGLDLTKFATRKNSEKGIWFEPVLFGEKTGIELCILGSDSDTARTFAAQQLREYADMSMSERMNIDAVERARNEIVARTIGIRVKDDVDQKLPITLGDQVIEKTSAGYRKLYKEIPELESWAREKSNERKNFLPKEKTSSSEQSGDSSIGTTGTTPEKGSPDA